MPFRASETSPRSWRPWAELLAFVLLVSPAAAFADDGPTDSVDLTPSQSKLSPIALFQRCYSTITRLPLPRNHRYYKDVKTGSMKPIEACLTVLRGALFLPDGDPRAHQIQIDSPESRAIVQTFNDFYRTWFPSDDFISAVPIGELYFFNRLVHDSTSPALHVTRATFQPGVRFVSIVAEPVDMLAIRNPGNVEFPYPGQPLQQFAYPNAQGTFTDWNPPVLTPSGDLIGVRQMDDGIRGFALGNIAGWPKNLPIYQSFGGGILGSQSYLMLNFGRGEEPNDGGVRVPRRWSKSILSDFLCRDLPAIRPEDAKPFVNPESPLPFQKGASCQQCHATIDSMAHTARNLRYLGLRTGTDRTMSMHMASYDVTGGAYHLDAPVGKLYFRSYDGSLVNKDVTGIGELGAQLAQTNDLYVCAASRYFEFFTGIRASLQDEGDPMQPQLGGGDLTYRRMVIKLGLELKKHQSVMQLIETILKSELYQKSGMRYILRVQ